MAKAVHPVPEPPTSSCTAATSGRRPLGFAKSLVALSSGGDYVRQTVRLYNLSLSRPKFASSHNRVKSSVVGHGGKGLSTIASSLRSSDTSQMTKAVQVKPGVELKIFGSVNELGNDLAEYVAELSAAAVKERGLFSVVLSGGSLIDTLGKLIEEPYFGRINWAKWHVFWADERVVKLDHPDSNYKLAQDGLLSKVPIPPGQVNAINDALSAEGAAADYETGLRHLVATQVLPLLGICPRFDLILLGMGPDGHVASLFPSHPLVHVKDKWVASITDSPKPPPERITLTFPVINSAANIAFVAMGSGKADMVKSVLGAERSFGSLPAQIVGPVAGKLVWFADEAAASKL